MPQTTKAINIKAQQHPSSLSESAKIIMIIINSVVPISIFI